MDLRQSALRRVRLTFVNALSRSLPFELSRVSLAEGSWVHSPDAWDPPKIVPWEETRVAEAEGELPDGVLGSFDFRILETRTQFDFAFTSTEQKACMQCSRSKFIIDGNEVFLAEAESEVRSGTLHATLKVSGPIEDAKKSVETITASR